MQQSKLIKYLKILKKPELNELGRIVKNPLFNRREGPIALFQHLKRHYPKFDSRALLKEEIYFQIFLEDKKFDPKKLEDTIYHLTKMTTDFLERKELNRNKVLKKFVFLNALVERGAFDVLQSEAPKVLKEIQNDDEQLSSKFYKYQIKNLQYCFPEKGNIIVTPTEDLIELTKELDDFYFINKLFYASELKARTEINVKNFQQELLSEVLECIDKNNETNSPLLEVLYQLFSSNEDSLKEYLRIKNCVFENLPRFSNTMQVRLITTLINRCKLLYSKQEPQAVVEWFALYKKLVDSKLLFEMNMINQTTFINIIHMGCNQKELDWVQEFIIVAKDYIPDEDLFVLGQSILMFEKGNYKEVIQKLQLIDFSHVHRNITCRSLLVKSFYKLKDFDILDNQISAFEIYLRRNINNAPDFLETNLKFLKVLKKLVKVQFQEKEERLKLQEKIKASTKLAYKSWLLNMVNNLN